MCMFLHMHVYILSHPSKLFLLYIQILLHMSKFSILFFLMALYCKLQMLTSRSCSRRREICCDPSKLVVNLDCTLESPGEQKGSHFCKILVIFGKCLDHQFKIKNQVFCLTTTFLSLSHPTPITWIPANHRLRHLLSSFVMTKILFPLSCNNKHILRIST